MQRSGVSKLRLFSIIIIISCLFLQWFACSISLLVPHFSPLLPFNFSLWVCSSSYCSRCSSTLQNLTGKAKIEHRKNDDILKELENLRFLEIHKFCYSFLLQFLHYMESILKSYQRLDQFHTPTPMTFHKGPFILLCQIISVECPTNFDLHFILIGCLGLPMF